MKLTIFFNGQFWEGVVELCYNNQLQVERHIFGAEPQDPIVLAFIVKNKFLSVTETTASSTASISLESKRVNPKRMARQISKEMAIRGVSTMAQDVMQQNLEERKQESQKRSKATKEAEAEAKWLRSRQKAKARHRGKG
jgi:hypothetical protein